jgi:hypothetical protein
MFNQKIYHFKIYQINIGLIIFYLLAAWVYNNLIFTNAFYYSILGKQLSEERITDVIELNKKFQWLGYVITPIFLLLKNETEV